MEIRAFAKVNLFLIIKKFNKKRQLHKINSVIKKVNSMYDTIEITKNDNNNDKIRYFTKDGKLIKIENCIVQQSLNLLRENKITQDFYNVDVYKNIPVGSGLGGGSSNAAEIIKFVVNENNKHLSKDIIKMSLSLGSDVPFFLFDYDLAFVSGFGEKVKKIKLKHDIKVELTTSSVNCSSKDVYEKYSTLIKYEKTKTKDQMKYLKNKNFKYLKNDLQNACFILYPNVKQSYNDLNNSIDNKNSRYKLSGGGSALFRIIE